MPPAIPKADEQVEFQADQTPSELAMEMDQDKEGGDVGEFYKNLINNLSITKSQAVQSQKSSRHSSQNKDRND